MLIDDVFYNTSENRYGVWYHYEGDMDEDGNANTDWVNVYDLFTWATPVKQAPQTETQLSDFEKIRLANMARNEAFFQSLKIESVKPRRSVKQRRKKAKAPVDVATSRTLRSATAGRGPGTNADADSTRPTEEERPTRRARRDAKGTDARAGSSGRCNTKRQKVKESD